MPSARATVVDAWTRDTLDAFTDTLIPGTKRYAGDTAVAGAAPGPGGADAGFTDLLLHPALALAPVLPGIATVLNTRAASYAVTRGIWLPPWLPAFVALSYSRRTAVVSDLFQPSDVDRQLWSVMALLSSLAFDAAAHLSTRQAIAEGHPGLLFLGFPPPGPDGLWRYPDHSYRRVLAAVHPHTTAEGSPP
ncbi:regulator [Streptomyces sp. SKN60]|nr:regulator [Streptomyces sp. SKN60]